MVDSESFKLEIWIALTKDYFLKLLVIFLIHLILRTEKRQKESKKHYLCTLFNREDR